MQTRWKYLLNYRLTVNYQTNDRMSSRRQLSFWSHPDNRYTPELRILCIKWEPHHIIYKNSQRYCSYFPRKSVMYTGCHLDANCHFCLIKSFWLFKLYGKLPSAFISKCPQKPSNSNKMRIWKKKIYVICVHSCTTDKIILLTICYIKMIKICTV